VEDMAEPWKDLFLKSEIIDLTHILEENMSTPSDVNPFQHNIWASYHREGPCLSYQCIMNEHAGTHVDAPAHFMNEESGNHITIEKMPLNQFCFPCAVIPIPGATVDTQIRREEIEVWEGKYGEIAAGEGVFFNTGWDRFWSNQPEDQTFTSGWPGLSEEAVRYLLDKQIAAVGTDCLSIDCSASKTWPAHHLFLGSRIPVFENLNHLSKISGRCYVISLPLPLKGGSASPVRVVGIRVKE